jgi:type VI secretion system protein ImpK
MRCKALRSEFGDPPGADAARLASEFRPSRLMQEDIANLVHPIFAHGLALRDRLEAGEKLNIEVEQAGLKAMLLTELEAQRWLDFGPDTPRDKSRGGEAEGADVGFLGIRYALTCWLDELFILYSPWERTWTERKLEANLYGTNDRAWRFWEQARQAENRAGASALEVFYLCVVLGFRGELLESPDKLQVWLSATQARLALEHKPWPAPPELEPPTFVPPLRGRDKLQRMVLACGFVFLLLVPLLAFLLVRQLGE